MAEEVEALPEELRDWLATRAEDADVSQADLLMRAILALRLIEEHEEVLPEELDPDSLLARQEELEERVADVEDDLDEKIDDVRKRVVQVKREADGKAPADHDHPDLASRVDAAGSRTADLADRLDDLEGTVEGGFANYEEVLEHLTDDVDDVREKLFALARIVAALRSTVAELERDRAERAAAADLKEEANRMGISTANCGTCESSVRLGLLAAPRCPHCGDQLVGVEPKDGFLGSPTLPTGETPAIAGETEPVSEEPMDVFDEEAFEDESPNPEGSDT